MIIMRKIKYYVTALLAGCTLSGCSDFLEPESQDEFVPRDAASMNEILLGEAYPRRDIANLNIFVNLLDDDLTGAPYQEEPQGFDSNSYWAPYTWQSQMYEVMKVAGKAYSSTDMYRTYYSLLKGANAVLDYVDDITDSAVEVNNVKAQAYALRGFLYFNLVNIYGAPYNSDKNALGVPLKLTSAIEERLMVRNTVEEVYAQILSDLHEAEALYLSMPEERQWMNNKRTSLPMVQLMLSRTYLYMEDWANASLYAKKVMDNRNFGLDNLNPNAYTVFHTYASHETIWGYGSVSDMVGWVADNYVASGGVRVHPYFMVSDGLMAAFDESEGDLRKDCYICRYPLTIINYAGEEEQMPLAFSKHVVTFDSKNYFRIGNSSTSFGRSLRLSEAYLNYAEAEAMLAQSEGGIHSDNARTALNSLRKKRFKSESYQDVNISDVNALIAFVHNERRRELCFEGHRWFDLRRWGMPEIKHRWYHSENIVTEYTLERGDAGYTVPIPVNAMELNNSLQQNPLAPSPRNGVDIEINNN